MKKKPSLRSASSLLAINAAIAVLLSGCATPDEHSYNKDFGENLPAQPIYSIQHEDDQHFILKVHQGVPLNGAARTLLSLIHISEPTRLGMISYAVFCLKKKKK